MEYAYFRFDESKLLPLLISIREKKGEYLLTFEDGKIISDQIAIFSYRRPEYKKQRKKIRIKKSNSYKNDDGDLILYGTRETPDFISYEFEITFAYEISFKKRILRFIKKGISIT